jgi:hypothetical protein
MGANQIKCRPVPQTLNSFSPEISRGRMGLHLGRHLSSRLKRAVDWRPDGPGALLQRSRQVPRRGGKRGAASVFELPRSTTAPSRSPSRG